MGMHPRFNSVTLDGISTNDRFGLNSNGYSTATGMPFPYDAIEQVAVELAPFDVTYGGFSACNINAVTKTGTNQWQGGIFYEYVNQDLRGDKLLDQDLSAGSFTEDKWGFTVGGPILKDRLFVFAAYEISEEPRFIANGFAGGSGVQRPWLSEADFNRIAEIADRVYSFDAGGPGGDGAQENEKYMVRVDWNINEDHNAALIYNFFDGFQDRASDFDSDEFEFASHFYVKGAETETITVKLASQWTDAFSTELFYSNTTMDDSQVTVGDPEFGDMQISVGGRAGVVYLGADDSRQANSLSTESEFFKVQGQYLIGDHVITAGYEREDLQIFNIFVQHSRGGEWDYFDSSGSNPASCDALDAAGRLADAACGLSGIDKFELGRPDDIYYGSNGGTNNRLDAAATFNIVTNAVYLQDELYFDDIDLTIVAGLRYEFFDTDDTPIFNQNFTDANGGLRNDHTIDGVDLLMPRLGFTWGVRDNLTLRGGVGLYSGGNPNVWISNAWSNDGISNVQTRDRNPALATFIDPTCVAGDPDCIVLVDPNAPGFGPPQALFDEVAAAGPADGSTSRLVLIDPNYDQPGLWKYAVGASWDMPWGITADIDYIHSEWQDPAQYIDLSQTIVDTTIIGQPVYDFTNGQSNLLLTNSSREGSADLFSIQLAKDFGNGLDMMIGYAYTEAEDVSPMTAATGGSNFDQLATNDINDLIVGPSNYVVPHRFTFRASYGREFFRDLRTRFTVYAYVAEGQPQTYVMGNSGVLEGGGFFARHPLYVPDGPSDPNVIFDAAFDQNAFFAWVANEGLAPGLQTRNRLHASWTNRIDIRIDQDIPTFINGTRGRLFLKLYNLGNFLSSDWGLVHDAQFFTPQAVVLGGVDSVTKQYIFSEFNDDDGMDPPSIVDLVEQRSLWEARIGIDVYFGE
jgi:hypothetical protein